MTAPDLKTARTLARASLKSKLIACANLVPGLESHYGWRGKIESSREILMILKTTRKRVVALRQLILARHPYDTPEFVVVSVADGSPDYLDWIQKSVAV